MFKLLVSKSKLFLFFIAVILFSANKCSKSDNLYTIETEYGDMVIRLYEATPKHKENFIKLVDEGFYDSLLFHRVINEFMIQGGDPDSKNAKPGIALGNGGPGYTIDAEIVDTLFHKRGVLAAARKGDAQNPEKKSSGSQFYIVQGKKFSREQLKQMAVNGTRYRQQIAQKKFMNNKENQWIMNGYKRAVETGAKDSAKYYQKLWEIALDSVSQNVDPVSFSSEQIKAYSTVGGSPHLDGEYTVFGEVVKGLSIIDSIAQVSTDKRSRPLEDIVFKIRKAKRKDLKE